MEDLKQIQEFFSKPLEENIVVRMYNTTDKTADLYKEDNPGLEFYLTGKEGQDYVRKYKDHISFPFSSHMNDGTPIPNYEENKEKLAAYLKQKGIPFKTTSAKPYRGVSRTTGEDFMYTTDTFKVPLSHVDIKDISLNENKVTKEDFDKVVKILSKSKYPFTIMLVPKWDEIDIITGQDSPDEIVDDISQRLDSAGLNWGGNSGITISGDSSNYSRREYSDIFRVNGGHKDYYEESYASSFGGFKKELDGETIENELQVKGYETPYTGIWNKILVTKDGERVAMIDTNESSYTKDGKSYQWSGIERFIDHVESMKKQDLKEFGSSDMNALLSSMHISLGYPKEFPGLSRIMDAAEDATDFYMDDFEEYKTQRDDLVMSNARAYARRQFPEFMAAAAKFIEPVDEAMDINDPVMMKMRAAKMKTANSGGDGNDKFFAKNTARLRKLKALKDKRAQIMSDMEQEAEMEGGPIADRYGDMLNKLDKAIAMLQTPEEKKYAGSPFFKENLAQTLAETIKLGEGVIEEELCPKGKRYIKARKAAGEKSSAYLSGRAVKVCKGQIEWPKKGKKK